MYALLFFPTLMKVRKLEEEITNKNTSKNHKCSARIMIYLNYHRMLDSL